MLKCAIFDMDGTVADILPVCVQAMHTSLRSLYSSSYPEEYVKKIYGGMGSGTPALLMQSFIEDTTTRYLRHYRQLHPTVCPTPMPGIPALLQELRDMGVKPALVTDNTEEEVLISLWVFGMQNAFEATETGDFRGPGKPTGIRSILMRLGISANEAVYIGDSVNDILAAHKVGMPVLAAAWGKATDADALLAAKPDVLCRTPGEAAAWLRAARQVA